MLHILAITAPIYLLIALGWLSVSRGWFARADMRVLGQFVVRLALPALLFRTLANRPLAEALSPRLLLAYATGSALALLVGWWWARRGTAPARGEVAAWPVMVGMGMSFSNSGFVGTPVLLQWLGPQAGPAVAMTMVVENLVMLPLALAMADHRGTASGSFGGTLRGLGRSLRPLATNPLVLAILAGGLCGAFNTSGQPVLPPMISRTIDLLANASAGVALLVIGGSLAGLPWRGLGAGIVAVSSGKLLLHPLMVGLLVWWWAPADLPLRHAMVALAAMPMMSIYPVLAQKYGHDGFCAAALLVTTVASFFSLSAWLWALSGPLVPLFGH
ncbi:AEC family transporter [Ideonella livida]|uniref:AEC family transporter n=1 Tax=Ideonella livida TaxID=2707176 RepID=A0A7C9PKR3_9BURK|nr:AEC family transporter [Ideonella livida]NDY93632.1 AEC family transporter [Ideonella livida]